MYYSDNNFGLLRVAYMVYLPEIWLMGSAGLMHNLLKMMVVAD